jgi:hypothetical protein
VSTWEPTSTGRRVEELFAAESGDTIIIAPFVKEEPLRRLCELVNAPVTLYTRWLPHEVALGVSDLGAFEIIVDTGGDVRLHPRLHAKLYLRGGRALAGSANMSDTGLGFRDPAAVELLVPVKLPSEAVSALLSFLGRNTPTVSREDRDAIAERTALIEAASLPANALAGETAGAYPAHVQATPLLEFRDPEVAWSYYVDPTSADRIVVDRLLAGLAGLGVPSGVTDEATFNAMVGAGMRQGASGRVLQECRNLPAFAAVERFRNIMNEAGAPVPAEAADRQWRTFCYWAERFVPEIRLRSTQVGF